MGLARSGASACGCSWGLSRICWRRSGEAFSNTQRLPSALTASGGLGAMTQFSGPCRSRHCVIAIPLREAAAGRGAEDQDFHDGSKKWAAGGTPAARSG